MLLVQAHASFSLVTPGQVSPHLHQIVGGVSTVKQTLHISADQADRMPSICP